MAPWERPRRRRLLSWKGRRGTRDCGARGASISIIIIITIFALLQLAAAAAGGRIAVAAFEAAFHNSGNVVRRVGICPSLLRPSWVGMRLARGLHHHRASSSVGGGYLADGSCPRIRPSSSLASASRHEEEEEGVVSGRRASSDGDCHPSRHDEIGRASSTLTLAPMMEYTDRHFRQLVRLVSDRTLLYTEMVSANALAHESRRRILRRHRPDPHHGGDDDDNQPIEEGVVDHRRDRGTNEGEIDGDDDPLYVARFVAQGPDEGPSVLQLGGSDPQLLFEASRAIAQLSQQSYRDLDPTLPTTPICDYTGLNLNCGCPSPKVAGKGCFGAALMDDPDLVRTLVQAMHEGGHGQYPVSVKCRIGTDSGYDNMSGAGRYKYEQDEYNKLCRFIETVAQDGIVTDFSVHARIAVLGKSFSPADNRKVPPLRPDVVHQLVRDYPHLRFTVNGGFNSIVDVQQQLQECPGLAGVMVGRAWAADPWSFAMADPILYNHDRRQTNRWDILEAFGAYADQEETLWGAGRIRRFLLRAVSPLFAGEPNAKKYRIALDEIAAHTKRLVQRQHPTRGGRAAQPPLSELLLDAAHTHLSQDTLFRTPEESYEMRLWHEQKKNRDISVVTTTSPSTTLDNIAEWQKDRKSGGSTYNQTLQQGLVTGGT